MNAPRNSSAGVESNMNISALPPWRPHQCADHAADCLDLARRPAGLREDGPQRVLRCPGARRRVEVALGVEFAVELFDQTVEFSMRRGRLGVLDGRLRQGGAE